MRQLNEVGANVFGTVLTNADHGSFPYQYRYDGHPATRSIARDEPHEASPTEGSDSPRGS